MKLSKFFITVLMITGLLVYISCRKADTQSHEKVKTETIEDKFFNSHRTTDPTEKALVDFLERQNNKLHFVEKTVKQIGYPRWDKALAVKNNSANKRGRSSNQDSVNIFYIPFVRDSQNFVNASLIIKTQATDTSFTYLCDWQYQNKPHGSPAESGSAEKHALLFMVLDNRMFGYTEFNLTDTSLFPAAVPRSGGGKKLGLLNVSNSLSAKMALAYHEICVDFYICGDLTYCANGCDYLNCISGPGQAGHCYLV
ncbi:MAG TPA: hypothetical protein VMR70_06800, partial [Flavisolibacter sp.]|nr:hypothetical protein [Flavisolibacter sp.]